MSYIAVPPTNNTYAKQQDDNCTLLRRSIDPKRVKMHTDFDHSVNLIFADDHEFILGYN
jgi:hypothetical protein